MSCFSGCTSFVLCSSFVCVVIAPMFVLEKELEPGTKTSPLDSACVYSRCLNFKEISYLKLIFSGINVCALLFISVNECVLCFHNSFLTLLNLNRKFRFIVNCYEDYCHLYTVASSDETDLCTNDKN